MGGRVFPMHQGRRGAWYFLADDKIKLDVGIGFVQAGLVNGRCIADADHRGDQIFAGVESKIVAKIFIAVYVDLGCQMAMARSRDEEVHMRRTLAMAPHISQQGFDMAAWGQP